MLTKNMTKRMAGWTVFMLLVLFSILWAVPEWANSAPSDPVPGATPPGGPPPGDSPPPDATLYGFEQDIFTDEHGDSHHRVRFHANMCATQWVPDGPNFSNPEIWNPVSCYEELWVFYSWFGDQNSPWEASDFVVYVYGARPLPTPTLNPSVTSQPTTRPSGTPQLTPTAPPSQGMTVLNAWPQGATISPGQTFNPEVTVQTTGFQIDCGKSFLENLDGNKYSTHPIQACLALGNNQYRFFFNSPMQAPDGTGEYHSQWKVWDGATHLSPAIDLWFRSAQAAPNRSPNPPTLKGPGDWSEIRSESAPALCWDDNGDPDGDTVAFWAEVYESAVIANSGWIRSTCWRPDKLDKHYFGYQWRVRTQDSKGAISEWSPTWHFTLSPPPYDPPQPTSAPPSVTPEPPRAGLWWDAAWGFRAPLIIPNNAPIAAGTIIKVDGSDLDALIGQGKSRADHNDVRVVRRVSETSWQEVARVYYTGWDLEFILPANLPAGTSNAYYLYYGNPHASTPPTFSLPQGWWVDMYTDKWWESYAGTVEFNQAMDFGGGEQICFDPINHRSRTGSSFDDSDKFRGRLFIPTTGTWTFYVYTNDGYRLHLDDAWVGHFDGYTPNRWATIGSMTLKAGWYSMDLRNMWVNCGAWRFAMEGPGFPNQIVPAHYFQKVWGNVYRGIAAGTEEPYISVYPPTATPAPTNTPVPTATVTPTSTPIPVPPDAVAPTILHTPLTATLPDIPLTLVADITDDVGVWGATLVYRPIDTTTYLRLPMVHINDDRYGATIPAAVLVPPGIEYYIEATDGVNTTRSGQPDNPYRMTISRQPQLTLVAPNQGQADGGMLVTLTGSNFIPEATVTFGGTTCRDVTFVSERELTCITPAHIPEMVDVAVSLPDGQQSTLLRGYTYISDEATVSLPHTGGEPNTTVQVPLLVEHGDDLVAFEGHITFDSTVLSVRRVRPGTRTAGWSIAANTATAGEIRLAMASPATSIGGSGSIAIIEFDVIGTRGMTSTLHLETVALNDGAINATKLDGSFTVGWVYDIIGKITFWKNRRPVPDAQVTLDGDRRAIAFTDETGTYTLTSIPAGTYTLTPDKRNDINGIEAYDASLILRHAAGLISLNGNAAQAADVNQSGAISAMDAYYVLQYTVGRISVPFPGAGMVWKFDPSNRTLDLVSNQSAQNFTGLLLGDVSGNWHADTTTNRANASSGPANAAAGDAHDARLTASDTPPSLWIVHGVPDAQGIVTDTLFLNPAGVDVYSLDLLVHYDPTALTDLTTTPGMLTQGWMSGTNSSEPGQLRLALAGALPITSSGKVLEFRYHMQSTDAREMLRLDWNQVNEDITADAGENNTQIYLPFILR